MEPLESKINATTVLEHLDWVRGLARSLVRDASLADDITQEAWLAALRRPAATGVASKGWLARVVRNAVRQENRRSAIRSEHEQRARLCEEAVPTDELVDRVHTQRMVVDAVLALDIPYQRVILLRYFEGLAPRDIANRQGIPVATVKTRLRRGLALLREALDKCNGGERATWMSAVTALAAPVSRGVMTGIFVIGGISMGTMKKVSAAILVATIVGYFVARTPPAEPLPMATVEPQSVEVELVDTAVVSAVDDPVSEALRRTVEEGPFVGLPADRGRKVLRVILEGITAENAESTRVTLTGVDESNRWPAEIRDSWLCQGLTSEFDLDPFFARVAERDGNLHVDELEVAVDYPLHFLETTRVPLSGGVKRSSGQTVYEVRVPLVPPVFWKEFTLTVRDAHTRAHLEDVELRCRTTAWMGLGQLPGTGAAFTKLGGGLISPIVLLGGHKADEDSVAGLALRPAAGEAPQPAELYPAGRVLPERGILMYARASGYAWGSLVLDVSTGGERELLLGPAAALDVRLANVQLERYAELEKVPTLRVIRADPRGGEVGVWFQELEETLKTEGLRLEALEPGEYTVSVEMGGEFSWKQRPVLVREELTLTPGAARELVLTLADPPAPPVLATLDGVVSFPAFGGEEEVQLLLYKTDYRRGAADVEFSLADMERVSGALPTWSFHLEDLPVGRYQVQLLPFRKNWMIELPAGGVRDVELVIPELAEVLVETVDARTGERIPLETIGYSYLEDLPGQVYRGWSSADRVTAGLEGEPGRFRFWSAPGEAYVQTNGFPSGLDYGNRRERLELVPGLQSIRFELEPVYALSFEFRVDGAALPHEDGVFVGLGQGIRAVDHEGRVSAATYWLYEGSAPGLYEISFEGIGADRFLPIPTRRVELRAGETTEVIVDLHRK